jgi:hypothetical protein
VGNLHAETGSSRLVRSANLRDRKDLDLDSSALTRMMV